MTAVMISRLPSLVAVIALVATPACGGYDDLPIRERAFAGMAIELLSAPSRLGPTTLELTIAPPASIAVEAFPKPWVIVGHPTVQSLGARIIAWARGPCDTDAAVGSESAFVLCAAVRWDDSDTPPEAPVVTIVVESRATAQRVTFIGEVTDTTATGGVVSP